MSKDELKLKALNDLCEQSLFRTIALSVIACYIQNKEEANSLEELLDWGATEVRKTFNNSNATIDMGFFDGPLGVTLNEDPIVKARFKQQAIDICHQLNIDSGLHYEAIRQGLYKAYKEGQDTKETPVYRVMNWEAIAKDLYDTIWGIDLSADTNKVIERIRLYIEEFFGPIVMQEPIKAPIYKDTIYTTTLHTLVEQIIITLDKGYELFIQRDELTIHHVTEAIRTNITDVLTITDIDSTIDKEG